LDHLETIEKHIHTSEEKMKWWGYGEWVEELDFLSFWHAGLNCFIHRICIPEGGGHRYGGHLCGYVKIPQEHLSMSDMNDEFERLFDVHGGVTFLEKQLDDGIVIGFDCAHSGDLTPSTEMLKNKFQTLYDCRLKPHITSNILYHRHHKYPRVYRNVNYVMEECKSLAQQIYEYGLQKS